MWTSPWTWCHQSPMSREQMASYVCVWIPMTSTGPSTVITTRHSLWRKLPMNSHTPVTSQCWTPTTDTVSLFLIRNLAYSQLSTAPLEDTASCVFPLALFVLKISCRRRWTRSWKSVKDALGSQMTSLSMVILKQNMMPISGTSCMSPANMG